MAGGVVLLSSSIVRPVNSNQSGRAKIHLTPYDLSLLQFDYAQRGRLFRKPDPDFNLISRLKTSLSLALDIYLPFAGRLVKTQNLEDETVSFHIDCDGSGARFLHAEAESVSVSDFLQPDGSVPDFITNHFFPADDFRSCDGVSVPLLVIQVTEMKDGVFISYCYNHMVADGVSMWGFFHEWSMICSTGSGKGATETREEERLEREASEEERKRKEEEEAQDRAEREAAGVRMRQEKALALGDEPMNRPGVTQVFVRFPNGERKGRSFESDTNIQTLYD